MTIDKKIKYKNKKAVIQGGVDNYLGKQPQVVAPRKWQSSPDKPPTELAYITQAEKDLILKKNMHGGLERGPNMGPSGIMSLDSFGDVGGAGASGGDTSAGGGAMEGRGFSGRNTNTTSERDFDRQKANQRAALQIAERAQAKDLSKRTGRNIKERADIATRTYGPLQKYTGRSRLFGGANKYGYTDTLPDGSLKPGYGGRMFGGLLSLLTGIPFVGGAIGKAYDYGKGIFGNKPKDMSAYNRLGLFGTPIGTFDEDEDEKISETSFTADDPNNILNQSKNTYSNVDLHPAQIQAGQFINDLNNQKNMASGMQISDNQFKSLNNNVISNKGLPATNAFTNSNFGLEDMDGS